MAGQEPFYMLCGAPVGIFLAHGKEYRHFRGILTGHQQAKALQGRPRSRNFLAPGHGSYRPGNV